MSDASGSCSAPMLALELPRKPRHGLMAGQHTVVTGSSFVWGCAADAAEREDGAESAMEDVTLLLRQGDREWTLGVKDAGMLPDDTFGTVTWRIALPPGVRPGRAVLVADSAELQVRIAKARPADRPSRRKVVRRASSRRRPGQ